MNDKEKVEAIKKTLSLNIQGLMTYSRYVGLIHDIMDDKMTMKQVDVYTFSFFMKYMCKTCKKPCSDIIEHIKKVHGFSESYIKDSLKTNSNSYLHAFEKIK